ncbi:hypothetical protein C8J56DRAFT_1042426 [Mycena floridula]|nr:hypothetical protein C8J56DRAFT_1042426 [Mycena floridula]
MISSSALSAPIRRIPAEILRNIFIFLDAKTILGGDKVQVGGFRVAAVSHHWRTVAFSTQELWNDIVIDADSSDQLLELLVYILDLSQQFPLKLLFREGTVAATGSLASALLQQSHRWTTAKFIDNCASILDKAELSFPELQFLSIHVNSKHCPWPPTPKLQTPKIHGGITSSNQWGLLQPSKVVLADNLGDTVSQMVLTNLPLNLMLELITHTPSLISLTIERCEVRTIRKSPLVVCTSSLISLSTVDCPSNIIAILFQKLDCPCLTEVSVDRGQFEASLRNFPHIAFISLLNRTQGQLKSLTFTRFIVSDEAMIQILEQTPSLTKLSLDIPSNVLSNSLLKRMDADREVTSLLIPQLEELALKIAVSRSATFQARPFVDMIQSRWFPETSSTSHISRLKKVQATFSAKLDDAGLTPLKVLKAAGMDLVLADGRGSISLDK